MSSNRKALKIVSFVQVIVAVLSFFMAFIASKGMNIADSIAGLEGVVYVYLINVVYAVAGVCTLISAVTGIHGANRPSALGSHKLFSILSVVTGLIAAAVHGLAGGIAWVVLLAAVAGVVAAVLDGRIRKELDR